jgi:hypothetical protein
MICQNCKQEVPAAKFCSNCAASLVTAGESRTAPEVDLPWLKAIYTKMGYSIVEPGSATTFAAKHDTSPNFFLDYRKSLRALVATSNWTMKPPTLLDKLNFYKTINFLNTNSIYVQCSVPETDLTTLSVQIGFYICDQVSELDVTMFNDFAVMMVRRVINETRLKPYIG